MPRRSGPPNRSRPSGRYGPRVLSPLRVPVETETGEEIPGGDDDATTQRVLIHDLRYTIDSAVLSGPNWLGPTTFALGRVSTLIYRNPKGIHAKFVLEGLGKNRVTFLVRHRLVDFSDSELAWLMREDLL